MIIFGLVTPGSTFTLPACMGSDDDALNLGARPLVGGRSPCFVLAAPFVLVGTSALQNLFWPPLCFAAVTIASRFSEKRDEALLGQLVDEHEQVGL